MFNKNIKDLEKKSIEKIIEQKNDYKKKIEKIKKDLSNNNKIINNKINSIKEEISSSSGNTSNASSVIDEENFLNMPFLETEEAAENIVDINEQRDTRKKDYKARTFAPPDNTEKAAENIADINK